MKYYLIEIVTGASIVAGKGVYEYESKKEALAAFHAKIGTAMRSDLYETQICVVIGDDDIIYANNKYDALAEV